MKLKNDHYLNPNWLQLKKGYTIIPKDSKQKKRNTSKLKLALNWSTYIAEKPMGHKEAKLDG